MLNSLHLNIRLLNTYLSQSVLCLHLGIDFQIKLHVPLCIL